MAETERILFLAGDVMTGRRVDELLATSHPADVWGDALDEIERRRPALRIVNLETSITTSDSRWPDKQFHFRMHPRHARCLTAAGFDCCVVANNHLLDFGYEGLEETLACLQRHGLTYAGAGTDLLSAAAPAVLPWGENGGRVLVFAWAHPSSFTPRSWAAYADRPGINLLSDLSADTVLGIRRDVEQSRRTGDLVVASLHWGGNWGYQVPARHRWFARRLIDRAGVDVVFGHSSHHPKAVEVYRGKPILYGCGDFINDYALTDDVACYRPDLTAMYFLRIDPATHRLHGINLVPMRIADRRLQRATDSETRWLCHALNAGGPPVGVGVRLKRWRRGERTRSRQHWRLDADGALSIVM